MLKFGQVWICTTTNRSGRKQTFQPFILFSNINFLYYLSDLIFWYFVLLSNPKHFFSLYLRKADTENYEWSAM